LSIRWRLTAWFLAAMALLVTAVSLATYLTVRSQLLGSAHSSAVALARAAAAAEPDEIALDRLAQQGDRIWLTGPSGTVVARTFRAPGSTQKEVEAIAASQPDAVTAEAPRPEGGVAIVAKTKSNLQQTLSTLRWALLGVGFFGLLLAGLLGALLAGRVLRPVDRMREEADSIPGDELERRLAEGRPDELGRLARAFNRLLERAQRAATDQEHFVADASHELKTPVTAIEGHARITERALDRGDLAQARESAGIVLAEGRRLALMLRELLLLAEGDQADGQRGPVRLDRIVAEACDDLRAVDPDRPLELRLEPVTLRELVRILVDNAFKYSPPDEVVDVSLEGDEAPRLTVRDHGPGLSEQDRERAFDRFFRGSAAHGVEGSGLGLAIARAICEQHGAGLSLDPALGGGTAATVWLTTGRASCN
jgi:two-component system, OmpR family, sensor histidine kinase MprB